MSKISIVIPTLNEEAHLGTCLRSIALFGAEIIVADGGSHDHTCSIARSLGAQVIETQAGRGKQLHAGAEAASGDILFFLHADTHVPPEAGNMLADMVADPDFRIGTFRLRLDSSHALYRLYSWFTRFDSLWTTFGDQGIVVRRSFYQSIGGFPPWPILEDVKLLQRARRRTRIRSFPVELTTSARRFEHYGILRQQVRNGWILLRYLLGARPERLAQLYRTQCQTIAIRTRMPAMPPATSTGIQVDKKLCTELLLQTLGDSQR